MEVQYDGSFDLATGKNRKETSWKNREWRWSEFLDKIKTTHRTAETVAEYKIAKKDRQDEIKDIGGFVGGYIGGGRRKSGSISYRQLLTLDIDFCSMSVQDLWDMFGLLFGCAGAIYSTHKHTSSSPRLRLIIPLNRQVTPEEYIAIGRRVAGSIGIDMFDDTTYEPSRLMYWPSTSADGEYVFEFQDGEWLNADEILRSYKNWRNTSEWSVSSRIGSAIAHSMKKQGDPLEKPGLIGAFCRTYDIHQAIGAYLSDEYAPCDVDNRYTYVNGSTAAGLVVYEDKFAYSHHGTDPCSGKLCNAFDLVRLHKFGIRDENSAENTPVNRLPSFLAMEELVIKDKAVITAMAHEKLLEAGEDFAEISQNDGINDEWLSEMDVDRKGNYLVTPKNIDLILRNDPNLKECFAYNLFFDRTALKRLPPWREKKDNEMFIRDDDEANLRLYLSKEPWKIEGKPKITDALDIVCRRNSFHPVRDYFNDLKWDGLPRLDTLFIDYLGAEDTELNRWITRIVFTAAVYRIYEPGAKFDQIVVLVGTQGCGKSTIVEKMAIDNRWFTSSMPSPDKPDKAADHLRGKFIVEIGELVGFKKAEVEAIKNFLSKRADDFHAPYGKNDIHRPRQCVFFATTNEDQFLRDSSGERRYWPIQAAVNKSKYSVWEELTPHIVGQIWAEAIEHYKNRMILQLPLKLNGELQAVHERYKKIDDWQGIIEEFLDERLPANWDTFNAAQRREYFYQKDPLRAEGVIIRKYVCLSEILNECVNLDIKGAPGQVERNRISNCMKAMEGWERNDRKYFKLYGRQRGWFRIIDNTDSEESIFDE